MSDNNASSGLSASGARVSRESGSRLTRHGRRLLMARWGAIPDDTAATTATASAATSRASSAAAITTATSAPAPARPHGTSRVPARAPAALTVWTTGVVHGVTAAPAPRPRLVIAVVAPAPVPAGTATEPTGTTATAGAATVPAGTTASGADIGSPVTGGAAEPPETCTQAYAEILQEVRVAQTALQFLLGFLMAVSVTPRFSDFGTADRALYVAALVLSLGSFGLLTAPAPFHRLVTDPRCKERLVQVSGRLALWGLVLLMLALSCAVLLVLGVVLPLGLASVLAGTVLCWLAGFWFCMPLRAKLRHARATARE
ncbi:DUF6328 family protein [Streptomyces sp. NPDC057638]|uniref:DUF6328 family protein n=1 Tax=Streptomyces sp. NPDC057638 TaxID=3346190 RepID=UPI00367C9671